MIVHRCFYTLFALLSTVLALSPSGQALATGGPEQDRIDCSLQDYRAFEAQLIDPNVEVTPDFMLSVMQGFLATCPHRIEVPSIVRRAARVALDTGDPALALVLYEQALEMAAPFERTDKLDLMAALIEMGEAERAWTLRDEIIVSWLNELEQNGLAEIASARLRDGIIHHARFGAVDANHAQSEVWLVVPYSGGWPAAIARGADKKRVALRQMVHGVEARAYEHLDLIQCRSRVTLAQNDAGLAAIDVDEVVMNAAKTYLRQPDKRFQRAEMVPVGTCIAAHRMFVSPNPRTAIPVW